MHPSSFEAINSFEFWRRIKERPCCIWIRISIWGIMISMETKKEKKNVERKKMKKQRKRRKSRERNREE